MQDSDDDGDRDSEMNELFSEVPSNEDILEENVGNIPESIRGADAFGRHWSYVAPKARKVRAADLLKNKKEGLTYKSKSVTSLLDYFKLFMSDEIIEQIVLYTNQKASAYIDKYNNEHEAKMKDWEKKAGLIVGNQEIMSTEDDNNVPLSLLAELWKVPPALRIEECNVEPFLSFDENLVIEDTNDMPSVTNKSDIVELDDGSHEVMEKVRNILSTRQRYDKAIKKS
ncbi:hypothetical protein QE152_g22287 [Popillia japonica]|uniref:Uncharacterized protein n=1 Tax=Popillia japonica TaxID=7064 RepID=A0AAW1KKU0_POPJA